MNGKFLEKIATYGMLMKVRSSRIFSLSWATMISLFIARQGIPPLIDFIKAVVAVSAIGGSIYIYNDVTDMEIDRANNSNRPLATGKVSKNDAFTFALILAVAGILISTFINLETLFLCSIFLALGFAYSNHRIRLKKKFMIKQLVPAIGGVISSLVGGTTIGLISSKIIFLGLLFFVLIFVGAPLLDLRDIFGDKKYECKTFAIKFGPALTVKIAISALVSLGIITLLSYRLIGFSNISGILVSTLCFVFALTIYPLLKFWQDPGFCEKTIKRMILLHLLIQVSFIVGSI